MTKMTAEELEEYRKEKQDYISRVKEHYQSYAPSIGFWKLGKIKNVYPLPDIEEKGLRLKVTKVSKKGHPTFKKGDVLKLNENGEWKKVD